jgi:predicted heme/steroid binding protein
MKKALITSILSIFLIISGCTNNQGTTESLKSNGVPQSVKPSVTTQGTKPKVTVQPVKPKGTIQTVKPKVITKSISPKPLPTRNSTVTSEKTFTLTQLSQYNGQNGKPAYVAVNGMVYDVTNAKDWNNGTHYDGATAGKDLSKVILDSPHGTSVLKKLPVVGRLKK